MNLSNKPLNLFGFVASLALFVSLMPAGMADPIDPSIIVRGASRGTYPIDESVEVLELTSDFFTGSARDLLCKRGDHRTSWTTHFPAGF